MQRRSLVSLLVTSCLVVIVLTCCRDKAPKNLPQTLPEGVPPPTKLDREVFPPPSDQRSLLTWSEDQEEAIIANIREKLKPVDLLYDENKALEPHQALHLHHMKTGGTSVDHLLKCARERLESDLGYQVDHYSIHECARGKFKNCVTNSDDQVSSDVSSTISLRHA